MATRFEHLLPALHRLSDAAEPVDLRQVGRAACLSPGRAQRVFARIIGESPKRYQLRVRLQRAAALLLGSEARVIDIATASGFDSHEAFTRAFGRAFGVSPTEYRRTNRRWAVPQPVRLAAATAPCIGLYRRPVHEKKEHQNVSDHYKVERRAIEETPVLFGTRRLDKDKIGDGLAEVLPAAFGYAMAHGLAMAGPPFVRYVAHSPAFVTVEAGVPLAEAPPEPDADAGISAGSLPAGNAAVTTHRGPYDTIGEAHVAIDRWMADNGVAPAGPPWEVYLTDPAEVPDPADWLTEVVWPIID